MGVHGFKGSATAGNTQLQCMCGPRCSSHVTAQTPYCPAAQKDEAWEDGWPTAATQRCLAVLLPTSILPCPWRYARAAACRHNTQITAHQHDRVMLAIMSTASVSCKRPFTSVWTVLLMLGQHGTPQHVMPHVCLPQQVYNG
jgi:hypothetical protein